MYLRPHGHMYIELMQRRLRLDWTGGGGGGERGGRGKGGERGRGASIWEGEV